MLRPTAAVLLSLVLLSAAGCSATRTSIGRTAPPKLENRHSFAYRLDNGFTVLVDNGDVDGPVALQVWVADGSADEPDDKAGLAHFVEHMLFAGSEALPPGEAADVLETMGGELTGHTGKDYSYVGVTIPGPGWEHALEVLFRMTTGPAFTPEQVVDQREVVAMEMSQSKTDIGGILMDGLFGEAYQRHPYRNPLTGYPETVKGFTAADAALYHSTTYVPSRMTLAVAGDVDPDTVRLAAERTFGTLKPGEREKDKPPREQTQLSAREHTVSLPVNLTYIAVGWHVCSTSDDDIYPLEVLRAVMSQGSGSRLPMELRERKALVLDIDSELFALRESGVFVVRATLSDTGDVNRVKDEILRQVQKLKDGLVSREELDRAVLGIHTAQMLAMDTAEGQAFALGYWSTVYGGQNPGQHLDNIHAVTPEDVRRAAQTYLGEGNYTISAVIPKTYR